MTSRESILNLQEQERTDPEVAHRSEVLRRPVESGQCSLAAVRHAHQIEQPSFRPPPVIPAKAGIQCSGSAVQS